MIQIETVLVGLVDRLDEALARQLISDAYEWGYEEGGRSVLADIENRENP